MDTLKEQGFNCLFYVVMGYTRTAAFMRDTMVYKYFQGCCSEYHAVPTTCSEYPFKECIIVPNALGYLITYYKMDESIEDDPFAFMHICDWEFYTVSLVHNAIVYDVVLNNREMNFYIIGNTLDDMFFQWYMNRYHNIAYMDEYSVSILNNKCDVIEMEPSDRMLFEKDGYKLI